MEIAMVAVKSSNIRAIGYDKETQVLAVEFTNGVYKYAAVPPEVHEAMMASDSVGKYFHAAIKGHYEIIERPQKEEK